MGIECRVALVYLAARTSVESIKITTGLLVKELRMFHLLIIIILRFFENSLKTVTLFKCKLQSAYIVLKLQRDVSDSDKFRFFIDYQ